jgi:hypothetical protein
VPSQSVEAATRDEAIAAAREKFGPTSRVVGVRRIRSGGMFGFFTNERYIAEVEVGTPAAAAGPDTGSVLKVGTTPAAERPAASMDDRMRELADLLGAAQESPPVGLYGRTGAAAGPAAAWPTARSGASSAPRPGPAESTRSVAPGASGRSTPSSPARAGAPAATSTRTPTTAAARRDTDAAKPFTPAKHTLMLTPEELVPVRPESADPVAAPPAAPSPFAAALTRMVTSGPVQAAAEAAVEAAAVEAAAIQAAATEAADAAAAQVAAVEAAAAEAARVAAARIDAAAARAARLKAEAAAAEAARLEALAAAAAAEAAAAAAAEAARIDAERREAERLEAARIEAERLEVQRLEAARIEAARIEAERVQAEADAAARIEAAAVEAARIEAERIEAERIEAERLRIQAAAPLSMVESVRSADEELATLLEEVLAANGSGRGRHRLPDSGAGVNAGSDTAAGDAAVAAATAIVEAAAQSAVPAAAPTPVVEDRVLDVPQPWAYDTRTPASSAYDTGAYRTDAYAGTAWTSDARVAQRAAQVAAAQNLVVDAVVVDETPAEELRHVGSRPVEAPAPIAVEEERFTVPVALAPALSPAMARTASDPAPLPMDATMVLPPLSLMPPARFGSNGGLPPLLSSRPAVPPGRRGRPPVPASRPAVFGRSQARTRPVPIAAPIASTPAAGAKPAVDEPGTRLATVTRLVPASSSSTAPAPFTMSGEEELVVRLLTLGLPDFLLGPGFAADAAARGIYAALTRTLAERLPAAPPLSLGAGEVLMVVGPGAETLGAARSLALSLRLEPTDVQWATSGALAGLAPESSRISSLETAAERHRASAFSGSATIVAVDAPLRTSGGPWLEHMLSVWSPSTVWAVLDSTRKPEDLVPWLDGLPRLDAVVVQDTDSTADPAAVLGHVSVPVALLDGARATAHRWASLLCERLEEMDA